MQNLQIERRVKDLRSKVFHTSIFSTQLYKCLKKYVTHNCKIHYFSLPEHGLFTGEILSVIKSLVSIELYIRQQSFIYEMYYT